MSARSSAETELDLVPIMNLVTILIPFLLIASSFASLAVINSTLPAIGPAPEPSPETDLNLKVRIDGYGIHVQGDDARLEGGRVLGCRGACAGPESYDLAGLTSLLGELKAEHADAESVVLVPDGAVSYDVLVATMDATRADGDDVLFPQMVIAGGQ